MTVIPENYHSELALYDTQRAIERIKHIFLTKLCAALHLVRVTAPLVVDPATGINDNLNGVERPVRFDVPAVGKDAEVVHSPSGSVWLCTPMSLCRARGWSPT